MIQADFRNDYSHTVIVEKLLTSFFTKLRCIAPSPEFFFAQINISFASAGLSNYFVRAMAIDPLIPTTLFAGTQGGGGFTYLIRPYSYAASSY